MSGISCRRSACRAWCFIERAIAPSSRRKGATWPASFPTRVTSSCPATTIFPFVGDQDALLEEIERFLATARAPVDSDRVLVTVLCGEGAGRARAVGGSSTEPMLERLRDLVADHASRFGGKSQRVEDGRVFVVFDGPARAIRCGCAIAADARRLQTEVRLGLHTGECDMVAGVPRGVVFEIGGRVASLASDGEILVTRTVVDLVAGSGLQFSDRGMHMLVKGHKSWRVYAAHES